MEPFTIFNILGLVWIIIGLGMWLYDYLERPIRSNKQKLFMLVVYGPIYWVIALISHVCKYVWYTMLSD